MTTPSQFGLPKIPDDRSVIVVSDLHLGGGEDTGTAERFCKFLEYIKTDFTRMPVYCHTCNTPVPGDPEKTKRLYPPKKIILLGDVLELWDTRNQDRNSAFLDALFPFFKMKDLDSDIVYVTGNHDEDIAEIITSRVEADDKGAKDPGRTKLSALWKSQYKILTSADEHGRTSAESIKFNMNETSAFEISKRHFPAAHVENGEDGLKIGDKRYAFVHGQQFDKEQITFTISEALGQRFDPVDYLQDLASISASRQIGWGGIGLNTVLTFVLGYIILSGIAPLMAAADIIAGLALAVLFLGGAYQFGVRNKNLASSMLMGGICTVIALGIIVALAAGIRGIFLWFVFLANLYLFVAISAPRGLASVKRFFYNTVISIKNKGPDKIVSEKKFDFRKFRYNAHVLVFGHTHVADFEKIRPEKDKPLELLVNTGTWVMDGKDTGLKERDTFAYIDRAGICLMRWVYDEEKKEGHVECLCKKKKKNGIDTPVPLCNYLMDNPLKE